MSRGVKDLRELICVSRLTYRDSDEELTFSDQEGRLSRAFEDISFGTHHDLNSRGPDDPLGSSSDSFSRQNSAKSTKGNLNRKSPDSGFGTNGISPEMGMVPKSGHMPRPPEASKPASATKKKKRKKKKNSAMDILPPVGQYNLPKPAPLPPVKSDSFTSSRPSSSSSNEVDSVPYNTAPSKIMQPTRSTPQQSGHDGNFDDMIGYLDATLISEFLSKANEDVTDLTQWCHKGDNFVQFCHFWLSDFPEIQRIDIFKLEYSILIDHLNMAFTAGRDEGVVRHRDITAFLEAVFREYPTRLMSAKGTFMFLDYLDVLISERHSSYKKLLSDVRCSTKVKQFAQWTLAVRAFCLVSIWVAVVNFYRRLVANDSPGLPIPMSTIAATNPNPQRIFHAIRNGYVDVVHYLLKSGKVKANHQDSHQRSLVFTAVAQNQPGVLNYFIHKIKPPPDLNAPADNGNSPLHAAANNGNVVLVTALLKAQTVDINIRNPQCEGATPLHLAVMHGHQNVVEVLMVAKADATLKMGDLTPVDIARDFGHQDILKVLQGDIDFD